MVDYSKFMQMGLMSPSAKSDAAWMGLLQLAGQLGARGAPRTTPTPPPIDLGSVMSTYQNALQNDLSRGLAFRKLQRDEETYQREKDERASMKNLLADMQVPTTVGEPATGQTATVMQTQQSPLAAALGSRLPIGQALIDTGHGKTLLGALATSAFNNKPSYDIKKIGNNQYARVNKNTGELTPIGSSRGASFAGTGMTAQAFNTLLTIGPKIEDGTANKDEERKYSLAHTHLSRDRIETINTPTGSVQQRRPGMALSRFPTPPGTEATKTSGEGETVGRSLPPKPTGEESQASGFAARMEAVQGPMNDLETEGMPYISVGQLLLAQLPGGDYLKRISMTTEQQQFANYAAEWIRAKLRKESGAAIPESEMEEEYKVYFPMPGDTPEVIANKATLRANITKEMRAAAIGADLYRGAAKEQSAVQTQNPSVKKPPKMTKEELRNRYGLIK